MDQIVSDFLVSTSTLDLKPNVNKFICCVNEHKAYQHVAGSASELHIEPLLQCVGDVDLMVTNLSALAVQSVLSDEVNLPPFYENDVTVYKMVSTQSPSYVKLLKVGELHKLSNEKYFFVESTVDTEVYFTMDFQGVSQRKSILNSRLVEVRGPAASFSHSISQINGKVIEFEVVITTQCLHWPLQASDWLVRRRHHCWPTCTTVEYIASVGCSVVPIIRRPHQSTDPKSDVFRLSFSRAETVLLNSWTTTQQIVYHMLRTVLSDESLTEVRDNDGRRIVSRYHIKTLTLWACELKDSLWWTRFNVVILCSKFLQLLSKHCVAGCCRGYFVTEYNLFECDVTSVKLRAIAERTSTLADVTYLTQWFITNYVWKYVRQFQKDMPQLSANVVTPNELHTLTSAIVSFCKRSACTERFQRHLNAGVIVAFTAADSSLTSILPVLRKLRTVDENLLSCFIACVSLRLSINADKTGYDDVINIMTSTLLFNRHQTTGSCTDTESNKSHIHDAVTLLQQIAVTNSCFTRLLLLSRCCLLFTCSLNTSMSSDEKRLSRIHLAILYYHLGHYKMAAEQCALVSANWCRRSVGSIDGLLLQTFDRDICNVLGLVTLYHHVTDKSLSSPITRQRVIDPPCNVFSVEVLAQFLEVKCSLKDRNIAQQSRGKHLKLYNVCNYLLHYITLHQEDRTTYFIHNQLPTLPINICSLESQLISVAVENLTSYHRFLSREFWSECTVVTTDVEALYAYKLGFYEHCLQLSQQNVDRLWSQHVFYEMLVSGIMTTLLADNLASLTGLLMITKPFSIHHAVVNQLTLSKLLMILCKLKLNFSMTSMIREIVDIKSLNSRYGVDLAGSRLFLAFIYRYVLLRVRSNCVRQKR